MLCICSKMSALIFKNLWEEVIIFTIIQMEVSSFWVYILGNKWLLSYLQIGMSKILSLLFRFFREITCFLPLWEKMHPPEFYVSLGKSKVIPLREESVLWAEVHLSDTQLWDIETWDISVCNIINQFFFILCLMRYIVNNHNALHAPIHVEHQLHTSNTAATIRINMENTMWQKAWLQNQVR